LGASYKALKNVTITGRINNLLDENFTSFDANFVGGCTEGTSCVIMPGETEGYTLSAVDHYNNKDRARNFWLSVNVKF
jgi:outer membrane receptor for ferrienterochelin and colicins